MEARLRAALMAGDANELALLALRASFGAARKQMDELTYEALPVDLRALHPGLFAAVRRRLLGDLLYAWLLARATGLLGEGSGADSEFELLEHRLQQTLAACCHAGIAAACLTYEELRDHDLSRFARLAEAADGLEHLAGVEKCGTFVLVCDTTGEDGEPKVVADFSLPCRLPCCCETPEPICLPPVAMPDFRTVQLSDGGEVQLAIDVLANDYDPNTASRKLSWIRDLPEELRDRLLELRRSMLERSPAEAIVAPQGVLQIELESDITLLGGTVGLKDDTIVYRHPEPVPGAVDRFTYRLVLKGGRCGGQADTGVVLVQWEPETAPQTGAVTGLVSGDDNEPLAEARVRIVGTASEVLTGNDGVYQLSGVEAGGHTIRASIAGYEPQTKGVTVVAGQTPSSRSRPRARFSSRCWTPGARTQSTGRRLSYSARTVLRSPWRPIRPRKGWCSTGW